MSDYENLYVLEWSGRQNAFHIHKAKSCIESNLNALLSDIRTDYVVLMIGSREDCDRVANVYRKRLIEREDQRPRRVMV